jgi:hypothetical protein
MLDFFPEDRCFLELDPGAVLLGGFALGPIALYSTRSH